MSQYVGNLSAGEKYKFEIIVRAKASSAFSRMGLTVVSSGGGNSLNYNYITSNLDDFQSGNAWIGNQFIVIGTITVGATASSIAVNIIDGQASTGGTPMTISGTAIFTLVGSISVITS
jgi:hypothetical protein